MDNFRAKIRKVLEGGEVKGTTAGGATGVFRNSQFRMIENEPVIQKLHNNPIKARSIQRTFKPWHRATIRAQHTARNTKVLSMCHSLRTKSKH